jgi:hypothetical protein
MQAFEACLQENGVDAGSLRSSGRPGFDPADPTLAAAMRQCMSLLPPRPANGTGPQDPSIAPQDPSIGPQDPSIGP